MFFFLGGKLHRYFFWGGWDLSYCMSTNFQWVGTGAPCGWVDAIWDQIWCWLNILFVCGHFKDGGWRLIWAQKQPVSGWWSSGNLGISWFLNHADITGGGLKVVRQIWGSSEMGCQLRSESEGHQMSVGLPMSAGWYRMVLLQLYISWFINHYKFH